MQTEPVFDGNQVIGVIGIATRPENFALDFNSTDYSALNVVALDKNGTKVFEILPDNMNKENNLASLTKVKGKEISFVRTVENPDWKITLQGIGSYSPNSLSTVSASLVLIILLNSIFSIVAGLITSQKKLIEEREPLSQLPFRSPGFIS
jgi:hypothetical protein